MNLYRISYIPGVNNRVKLNPFVGKMKRNGGFRKAKSCIGSYKYFCRFCVFTLRLVGKKNNLEKKP